MSSFIRGEVFDWLIGSVQLSNNIIFNLALASILGTVLYVITFRMVGDLYRADLIGGSLAGKIAYFILFIINVFITATVLRMIKGIIWLYHYLLTVPLWIYLSIAGGLLVVVALIIYLKARKKELMQTKQKVYSENETIE